MVTQSSQPPCPDHDSILPHQLAGPHENGSSFSENQMRQGYSLLTDDDNENHSIIDAQALLITNDQADLLMKEGKPGS